MMQTAVMAIWRDVLQRDDIGLDDNFFDIGGDSSRLAASHTRIEDLAQRKLPLVELFRYTTVRTLSAWLVSLQHTPASGEAVPGQRDASGRARIAALRRSRSAGSARREFRRPDNQGVADA